jgi:hypothetical protein
LSSAASPVDEHAGDQAQIVALALRDDAVAHGVDDRSRHRRLRRSEHLDRLNGPLDRDLVGHDRVGLRRQVGRNHRQEVSVALALVIRASAKALPTGPSFEPMVDVSDLVALSDKRLASAKRRGRRISARRTRPVFLGERPRHDAAVEIERGEELAQVELGRSALAGEYLDARARIVMVAQHHVLLDAPLAAPPPAVAM